MSETLSDIWDLTPDLIIRIEAVHRLSGFGAVVTHVQRGTSTEGFDAEWRMIQVLTVEADRISRLRNLRRGRSRRRARPLRTNCIHRRRVWRTRQAKWGNAS